MNANDPKVIPKQHASVPAPSAVKQAWTIAKIELRRAFFSKRAFWVYGLALFPAIIFFGHVFLGIFSFIPGNVGSMEGVFLTVFALLGLGSDRSLIFSMIMRIGQVIMVALGVGNIVVSRIAKRAGKGADRIRTDA